MNKHVFGMTKKTFMNRVFSEVVGSGSMVAHLDAAEKFFNGHPGDEDGALTSNGCESAGCSEVSPLREQHGWFEAKLSHLATQNQYQKDDLALIPISQIKEVFEQSEKILAESGE